MTRLATLASYLAVVAAVCAAGVVLLRRGVAVERGVAVHEVDIQRLNTRLQRLELRGPSTPAPVRAELDPVTAGQVAACGARTENLRTVLEALVRVWPGRSRLPDPPGGWPAWPAPSSSLGSAMPVQREMTEGELAAMRKEWSRP